MRTTILAFCIIVAAVTLAITSVWGDALVVDEIPHIGAGYSYLVKQDMRLNPEHPPLVKDLAAIPMLFLDLKQTAFSTKYWTTDINGQWDFGRNLIFQSGNDVDLIAYTAKIPMLALFVLTAWLIFSWARQRYGNKAAVLALVLFSFSPTIMAHARFVTTDVAAAFGVLLASYFFIRYLKESTFRNLLFASLAIGIALLTKFSVVLILPFLFLMSLVWGWVQTSVFNPWREALRYGLRSIIIFVIGFVVVVWPVYVFHTWHYPPDRQRSDTAEILKSNGLRPAVKLIVWMSDKPILRAVAQYGFGFLMVQQRTTGGNTAYFLGNVSATAWKQYFPVVYFIKEPLAWWGLVIVAIVAMITNIKNKIPASPAGRSKIKNAEWVREHFDECAMLLWITLYWMVSISGNLNIGVRHLLPVYPFTIMLVSRQAVKLYSDTSYKALRLYSFIALITLVGWYVVENIRVYPYYLTYFNQVAGGPAGGYRYVVDSNLDWGQDLKRFTGWVKDNNIKKIELDYFGWSDPTYYLGDRFVPLNADKYTNAADFINRNKTNGWLAVSASFLQVATGRTTDPWGGKYRWLKAFTPDITIGNSIFVYHFQ